MSKTYRVTAWRGESPTEISKLNILDLNSEWMVKDVEIFSTETITWIDLKFPFADTFLKSKPYCGFLIFICPEDIPSGTQIGLNIAGGQQTLSTTSIYDTRNNKYADGITKGRLCILKFLDNRVYLLNV